MVMTFFFVFLIVRIDIKSTFCCYSGSRSDHYLLRKKPIEKEIKASISNRDSYCAHSDLPLEKKKKNMKKRNKWEGENRKSDLLYMHVPCTQSWVAAPNIGEKVHVNHVWRLYLAWATTNNLCFRPHVRLLGFLSLSLARSSVLLMSSIGADLSE